jgi:hypothetical protein
MHKLGIGRPDEKHSLDIRSWNVSKKIDISQLHLSLHHPGVILETTMGLLEVARNFRSIEPPIVQVRVPNSSNADRRVDPYIKSL